MKLFFNKLFCYQIAGFLIICVPFSYGLWAVFRSIRDVIEIRVWEVVNNCWIA